MEIIDRDVFEKAKKLPDPKKELESNPEEITEEKFQELLESMQNPVQAQQHLAVQVKTFLDKRISDEMRDKGFLSDHTRRWVEQFNKILDSIQKALYGDKSVNLHVHKVSHSHIAAKIREVQVVEIEKKRKKKAV